jgi:hypothetical protein
MGKEKTLQIKNSTTEFLLFTSQNNNNNIEVIVQDEDVWLTQKTMGELYDVVKSTISEHIKNIYEANELQEESTVRNFRTVQKEGSRSVERELSFYNLDMIISVGYRVNSVKAVEFRKWATNVIKNFAIKGYVLDNERLKNGSFLGKDYFEKLLEEIREIRASERMFYQKITDIYSTAVDYDPNSQISNNFFSTVQNKLHYAIHGKTAAELIGARSDATKQNMGLTNWKNSPDGKVLKSDTQTAKNYLEKDELKELNRVVSMYLDYAENQATRGVAMTMEQWSSKLNAFLEFNDYKLLNGLGQISAEDAKLKASKEYDKFRITQDKLFESSFDKLVEKIRKEDK